MPNTSGLTPFTKETASAAGRKSAAVRAARRDADVQRARDAARTLDALGDTFQRDRLGPDAAAVAALILSRIASGDIVVKRGDEAAALLRALVDVARLEAGEATSHTLRATVDQGEAVAAVIALRDRARSAIGATSSGSASATALAADDPGSSSGGGANGGG